MKINEFIPNKGIYSQISSENKKEEFKGNTLEFGETLKSKLNEVNEKQLLSEETTNKFIKGEDTDIHDVMIKTAEAKMSLQLAVQVRNKLLEAYQEINRMQV